ncbi:MAG: hypothetical protein AAGI37_04645 [Planctomycetota bacterium]
MTIPDHIQKGIQAYYAERASREQIALLEQWFREDEANVRVFAEHGLVEWHMLCEHEKQDAAAILATLREAEEQAGPNYSLLDTPASFGPKGPEVKTTASFGDLLSLTGYLTAKTLRNKSGLIGSIAAVLLLGVALFFAFSSPDNNQNTPPYFADNYSVPGHAGPPSPSKPNIVATLTAERDAVWHRRPGDDLYAGQRFTLAEGFAEITTNRGAVAILEAPATFELTDNDNALWLHTGKLVGICDSASSKGLMVYTRQLQLHDLGTRFGVDASASDTTIVQVFQGEVEVSRAADSGSSDGGSDPVLLLANEAISASADREQWTRVDPSPDRFAVLRPIVQTLRGSGKGIRLREVDPQWQVVAIDGQPVDRPIEMVVSSFESHTKNFPNDPSQSQWVAYLPSKEVADRKISYVVRTTLELPDGIDPASASIRMRYIPDNDLRSLRVNGAEINVPEPTSPASEDRVDEFTERYELWISSGLVEGQNTIEFELVDYAMVVGINVQWELYATSQLPQWSDRP